MTEQQRLRRLGAYVAGTFDGEECPEEGCDEVRFSDLGMEYHLMNDHEIRPTTR